MKPFLLIFALFTSLTLRAQEEGIRFGTAPWNETLAQAGKENKLVFLDCYTSWCAPCKWMDKNVFVLKNVADFYNGKFVNTKFDMEKGEGIELRKKYNVQSFPTYLFINSKGEIVHRTGSRMTAEEFLEEGRMAADPDRSLSSVAKRYADGQRDIPFLLNYYLALSRSDRQMAEKIAGEISGKMTDSTLGTPLGWKAIKHLARTSTDKFGKYYLAHQDDFRHYTTGAELDALTDRLLSSTLYGHVYAGNEAAFYEGLKHFSKSPSKDRQQQAVMLEAEFLLRQGRAKQYIALTNKAMKGVLNAEAEKLSFLARRISGKKEPDEKMKPFLPQAYKLAKRAVEVDPEEYSVQSTFGWVCLSLKKKDEGLKAARKARALADAETSKIQKLAQELVDEFDRL
ncbi:thioredoxin family protein [Chitinophaga rhizosphaerae]|uniref:thioredoxin family protein n=1 Tax=Chitinophaga rhizosphaerae TaxID=1864947 RepID=UPI000F7FC84B|nr:thioredoxin fold domain-containing protein [Chitinophaga rhizosphaerae]